MEPGIIQANVNVILLGKHTVVSLIKWFQSKLTLQRIFEKIHLFSAMRKLLHLTISSMVEKESAKKHFVGILYYFHRTETKIACNTISHKYIPGVFFFFSYTQ